MEVEGTIGRNVSIAGRVFGNRFLEILATIYLKKAVGANELATTLGDFTKSEMVRRLRVLETAGLVEAGRFFVVPGPGRYTLSPKGSAISPRGEARFFCLRLCAGVVAAPLNEYGVDLAL